MKTSIKNITEIQTGLFARPMGRGDVLYLQVKHFDDYGQLQTTLFPDLSADDIPERHLLKPGDVLFAAKGTKNFAAIYESHNRPAVASTSFFVIRIKDENVLPEYLVWFLNNHAVRTILKEQAIGTSMASISKTVLEGLEINIPNIEIQNKILQIVKLRDREKILKQKIDSLREKQIQQQIIQAITLNDER